MNHPKLSTPMLHLLWPLCTHCAGRAADLDDSRVATCPKEPQVENCGALALYNASVGGGPDAEELCGIPVQKINPNLMMRYMGRPLPAAVEAAQATPEE